LNLKKLVLLRTLLSFWSDGSQQDAHEFLQFLMSFVNECDLYLKKLQQQHKLNQIEKKEKELNAQSTLNCLMENQKIQNSTLKSLHTPTKGGASQSLSPINNTYQVPVTNNKRLSINDELIFRPIVTKMTRSVARRNKIRKSWIELGKLELKECYVLLERVDETKLVNGMLKLFKPSLTKIKSSKTTTSSSLSSDIRKFKVRSRTFPCVPTTQDKIKEDLDEITQVEQVAKNEFEKPLTKSKRLTRCRTFSNILNNDLLSSRICKSPAELLRKYASIKGHVCEMDKLFKGTCLTITQCLSCETLKKSPEYFYDRSLPVNINNECMDVDWIVEHLINESYLNDDSKYMCETCACKQEAKIYTQYNEMPNILILHLLSYGLTSTNDGNLNAQKLNNRSKLASHFNCICEKCKSNELKHIFKLYAVVMHSGISLNSGHYTAYINYNVCMNNNINLTNIQITSLNDDSNIIEWLHFDDSKVKYLSSIEFNRKIIESNYDSPYILFYIKENIVDNQLNK
jgi:ubiquitin C-terminal hydrolase